MLTIEQIIEEAKKAREKAYAPYSNFKVGAVIECKDGKLFYGANVENASYGATNCAERTAVFKAVSEGCREFDAIAIVASSGDFVSPCGICRQVLAEFMPDGKVILDSNEKGMVTYLVRELLPLGFTSKDIR
jgi:cytidine deaminase